MKHSATAMVLIELFSLVCAYTFGFLAAVCWDRPEFATLADVCLLTAVNALLTPVVYAVTK